MEEVVNMGFISLIPAILAIVLCFVTRNTIMSIAVACITGCFLAGQGVFGFPALLRNAVGTTDFAGVMLLNIFVGILVAFFQKTGAIQVFSQKLNDRQLNRKAAQLIAWVLGTFAICTPLSLPLAFTFTNNQVTALVVAVFAAVAGGGVFGDHCSPLSDTTILSSTGAACDHLDHVKTQLPYALICGAAALVLYLLVGLIAG